MPENWASEAAGVAVSTRYRQSSAMVNDAPWYFETFGFRDGRIVWESWAYDHAEAERQHDLAARYYRSRPTTATALQRSHQEVDSPVVGGDVVGEKP